jgi:GNAT superfamily N-acetyltransferase
MRELRKHLRHVGTFVERVDTVQRPEGYRMVGVFEDGSADATAVAGFRVGTSLSWGRHLYVDDLSTVTAARGRGCAGQLLSWIAEEARRLDCGEVHLDSGVGLARLTAHRFYLNRGFAITAHHFARTEAR